MKKVIQISEDGTADFVGEPPIELGQVVKRQRAGNILPLSQPKRAFFIALRKVFGDQGRIAAWTRKWKGPWEVRIIGSTRPSFYHRSRRACENWERKVLNEMRDV